jgi:hypothetical protein
MILSRTECAQAERRAGAIALGEASDGDREAYRKHLAACLQCLRELGGEVEIERVMQSVARARDAERWEPDLGAIRTRKPLTARAWIWAGAFGAAIVLGIGLRAAQTPQVPTVRAISASEARALAALTTQTAPGREGRAESLRVGGAVTSASFTVAVDARGRAVRCTIVKSSGNRAIDASICRSALHTQSAP